MTTMLKPGLLVSLKTILRGNVNYVRQDLGAERCENGGGEFGQVSRWETTKTIDDLREHEEAVKVRNGVSSMIRRQCKLTSFGLLCPTTAEPALDQAIRDARELTDAFNVRAEKSYVDFFVLKGRIAETDEEATRAIVDEVKTLLDQMEEGIRDLDPRKIREAATRAKAVNEMLQESQNEKVGEAIKAARTAARQIVKRVEKAGEDGNKVLVDISTKPLDEARFAFLDLEPDLDVPGADLPPVSAEQFNGLDMEESDDAL
jgi:hypothetical protein